MFCSGFGLEWICYMVWDWSYVRMCLCVCDENDENFAELTLFEREEIWFLFNENVFGYRIAVCVCVPYLGSFCCILDGRRIVTSENVHLENGFYPLSITLHTSAPQFESGHSMGKQRTAPAHSFTPKPTMVEYPFLVSAVPINNFRSIHAQPDDEQTLPTTGNIFRHYLLTAHTQFTYKRDDKYKYRPKKHRNTHLPFGSYVCAEWMRMP